MSRTESTMVKLGTIAPSFELLDVVTGRALSRDDVFALSWDDNLSDSANGATSGGPAKKHGLLIMFVCPHCPYVQHIEQELGRIGRDYFGERGEGPIAIAAIQSNDLTQQPQDAPDGMREQARRNGWTFPYLLDEDQETAKVFGAACTPDFFLFNGAMELVYRGQLDDSRPRRGDFGNDVPVSGKDLRAALDAVIAGKRPDPNQRASIGCNIKWADAPQPNPLAH
ncbi:MAG TPA: thioredoxin family protein [Acidobacteriaceae bacterium]|jgi:thiol-disulfide isomerase/thioredoxin|nr:thioredoxin family protein [Acidobacteriaceae bacterium]